MTPLELTDAARNICNVTGSSFVTDAELLTYLNFGLRELSTYSRVYEAIDVYSSVASQATYPITASIDEIKQVKYDGIELSPITFKGAARSQYFVSDTNAQGFPDSYYRWVNDLTLIVTPAESNKSIQIYHYGVHPTLTTTSVISIPEGYQHYLVDYVVYRIRAKELGENGSVTYLNIWNGNKEQVRKEMLKRSKADSFNQVFADDLGYYGYGPRGVI